jgi:hypothetical protein
MTEARANDAVRRVEDEAIEPTAEERLMALGDALEVQLRERPYVTLAAAAGAGFILAQALSSRVGRIALLAAGGFAATRLLRGDGMRFLERALGDEGDDEEMDDELASEEAHMTPQ